MAHRPLAVLWSMLTLLLCCQRARGSYVEYFDCFHDSSHSGAQLRFSPYYLSAFMSNDDGFPLQILLYGVFSNASMSEENATMQYQVHPTVTVDISTVGFSLLHFNASRNEIANGQSIYAFPETTSSDVLEILPPVLNFTQNLGGDLSFTTLSAVFKIYSEDDPNLLLGCVQGSFTPSIGYQPSAVFRYLPLVILFFVGLTAAIESYVEAQRMDDGQPTPDGAQNSSQPHTLLRIGDCLQYIQFIMLSGCLTVNYPGYYQQIISNVSWSTLMFKNSFIGENPFHNIEDGIYQTNGTGGIVTMSQAIGNISIEDLWINMLLCLLCIVGGLIALIQLAYFIRWSYRTIMVNHIRANLGEPSPSQKFYYTFWNVIKLVFSYFLLPIVALSVYEISSPWGLPLYATATAVIIVLIMTLCLGILVWYLWQHKNSSFLIEITGNSKITDTNFGFLRIRLAPHFGIIPVLLTWLRGAAMGGLQNSGTTQLIILVSCEIVYIIAIFYFRPYPSLLSSNVCLSVCRLITLALAIDFLPEVNASVVTRGWTGYIILTMHAGALVLGFLLTRLAKLWTMTRKLIRETREFGATHQNSGRRSTFRVYGSRQLFKRTRRTDDFDRLTAHFQQIDETSTSKPSKLRRLNSFGGRTGSSHKYLQKRSDDSLSASTSPRSASDSSPTQVNQGLSNRESKSQGGGESGYPPVMRPYHRLPRPVKEVPESSNPNTNGELLISKSSEGYDPQRIAAEDVIADGTPLPSTSTTDYSAREADLFYGVGKNKEEDPFKDTDIVITRKPPEIAFSDTIMMWFTREKPKPKKFEVIRPRRPPSRTGVGEHGDAS